MALARVEALAFSVQLFPFNSNPSQLLIELRLETISFLFLLMSTSVCQGVGLIHLLLGFPVLTFQSGLQLASGLDLSGLASLDEVIIVLLVQALQLL